jgi:hypothetical protein
MTTDGDENVFIKDGILNIKPTIQDASLIEHNRVLDLRGKGCTGPIWTDCVASTNTTNGTIINPVKSGRINTKLGASIQFGRVEVTAKLPAGDWLWPAIWMLPVDNKYGEWPKSGEIDIMEGRGNNHTYAQGGNNIVSSTLHFGPNSDNDGWWRNNVKRDALHTTYAAGWHTFGLEVSSYAVLFEGRYTNLYSGLTSTSSHISIPASSMSCICASRNHSGHMDNSPSRTVTEPVCKIHGAILAAKQRLSIKSSTSS